MIHWEINSFLQDYARLCMIILDHINLVKTKIVSDLAWRLAMKTSARSCASTWCLEHASSHDGSCEILCAFFSRGL